MLSIFRFRFAGLLAGAALFAACGSTTALRGEGLKILYPSEFETVSNHQMVEFRFRLGDRFTLGAKGLHVEVSRGNSYIPLVLEETKPWRDGYARARWRVEGAEPGEWRVTVTGRRGGHEERDSVPFFLHAAPVIERISIVSIQQVGRSVEVEFRAHVDTPSGLPVERYTWHSGDGTPVVETKEPRWRHRYVRRADSYNLEVDAFDGLGGTDKILRPIKFAGKGPQQGNLEEDEKCGCTRLTIRATAGEWSGNYCGNPPGVPGCEAVIDGTCPGNAFRCPLGVISENGELRFGFEPSAALSADTDDLSECSAGQYVQSTYVDDGVTVTNPLTSTTPPGGSDVTIGSLTIATVANGARAPAFGATQSSKPLFGADNYTSASTVWRASLQTLRWYDAPGGATGQDSGTIENDFISFVNGNDGSCWCRFKVEAAWTKGNAATGAATLEDGSNCVVN
ncbi:MAG: hypothetical protein AAF604_06470 [Acidobacteriota bacterium]